MEDLPSGVQGISKRGTPYDRINMANISENDNRIDLLKARGGDNSTKVENAEIEDDQSAEFEGEIMGIKDTASEEHSNKAPKIDYTKIFVTGESGTSYPLKAWVSIYVL